MTRDQIIAKWETLTPRERDAWVAEVVFGWERRFNGVQTVISPPEGDERRQWAAVYDEYGCPHWLPRYTTDTAASWSVLEEMRKGYCVARIDKFYRWRVDIEGVYAIGAEAEEMVCLASILRKLTPKE